jgi:hypothetical protein
METEVPNAPINIGNFSGPAKFWAGFNGNSGFLPISVQGLNPDIKKQRGCAW